MNIGSRYRPEPRTTFQRLRLKENASDHSATNYSLDSPACLVAKANAIKTLDEDIARQAMIAASLADDVLRHFNRAA